MSYKQNPLAANANINANSNANSNIHVPEDDIDTFFSQLQQVEPPQTLIARILSQIPQQASTTYLFVPPLRESEITTWATHTRQKNLC